MSFHVRVRNIFVYRIKVINTILIIVVFCLSYIFIIVPFWYDTMILN